MIELECPECHSTRIVKKTGRGCGCPCEKNQYVCLDCGFFAALVCFEGDVSG